MNDKFTIQELIALLAQRHQMEPADADTFVRTFFALIEEALETDRYIKIKGLGTFKLIEVDPRESVDVNTGERIEIQGHSRITFNPDPFMRDWVNKPFSHFETVVLNENIHFDDMDENGREIYDMEVTDEDELPDGIDDKEEVSPEQDKTVSESGAEKKNTPVQPDITSGDRQSVIGNSLHEEYKSTCSTEEEVPSSAKRILRLPWCMIATILFVGILIGGGIVWGILSGRRYIPESVICSLLQEERPEQTSVDSVTPKVIQKTDTASIVISSTQPEKDTIVAKQVPVKTLAPKKEILADTVEYLITGTQGTYTIKPGETLAKVSLKFYGSKKLWPYLVRHNKDIIKDANNIPKGITIRIPSLVPKSDKK